MLPADSLPAAGRRAAHIKIGTPSPRCRPATVRGPESFAEGPRSWLSSGHDPASALKSAAVPRRIGSDHDNLCSGGRLQGITALRLPCLAAKLPLSLLSPFLTPLQSISHCGVTALAIRVPVLRPSSANAASRGVWAIWCHHPASAVHRGRSISQTAGRGEAHQFKILMATP